MRHSFRRLTFAAALSCCCALLVAEEKTATPIDLLDPPPAAAGSAWKHFSEDPDARFGDVWQIKDGVLVCKGSPKGYIYTVHDYNDFVLKLQWRWPPEGTPGKGGVLLRTTGKHKIWPKSLEAQINTPDAGDFWGLGGFRLTGPDDRSKSLEHPQLGRLTNVKKTEHVERPAGQWNDYEIIARGDVVVLKINGHEVNRATGCETTPGKIVLTAEGDEIHFRNVMLVPIEKLFNGKDLSGWSFRTPNPDAKMDDTWSVRDGELRCTGKPGGYLQTDKKYTNYKLKLQWRWPKDVKPGNNGVLVRVLEGEHFYGNVWPKCVEIQLLNQHAADILTIGKYPLKGDPERTRGRYTSTAHPSNEKPPGELGAGRNSL